MEDLLKYSNLILPIIASSVPIVTIITNAVYNYKIKKLEFEYQERRAKTDHERDVLEKALQAIGTKTNLNLHGENEIKFSCAIFNATAFMPDEDVKKLIDYYNETLKIDEIPSEEKMLKIISILAKHIKER